MTYKALLFISKILDEFLKSQFGINERRVIVNRLIELDGSIPALNQNKVIITLINIENESGLRNFKAETKHQMSKLNYSINFLVSSNFDDYLESLKYFDVSYNFLLEPAKFTAASYPDFPSEINSFHLEMSPTTIEQISNLMISIGAKYQPSVLFNIRLG